MVNSLLSAMLMSYLFVAPGSVPQQMISAPGVMAVNNSDSSERFAPVNNYGQNAGDPGTPEFVIRKTRSGSLLYKVVGTQGDSSENAEVAGSEEDDTGDPGVDNQSDESAAYEMESDTPSSTKMTRLRVKGKPHGVWKKIDKELALGEVELEVFNAGEVAASGIEVYVRLPGNRIRRKKIEGPTNLERKESAIFRSAVDETVNSVARLKFDLECSNCRR